MKSISTKTHKKSLVAGKSPRKKISGLFKKQRKVWFFLFGIGIGTVILMLLVFIGGYIYETHYSNRVFPGVLLAKTPVGGLTQSGITQIWLAKNNQFKSGSFTLQFENHVATLSAQELGIGFDAT